MSLHLALNPNLTDEQAEQRARENVERERRMIAHWQASLNRVLEYVPRENYEMRNKVISGYLQNLPFTLNLIV